MAVYPILPGVRWGFGFARLFGITDTRKTFHSHRHTVATLFAALGVRRDVAYRITGHSSDTEGDGYIHHSITTLAAAIDQLPIPGAA